MQTRRHFGTLILGGVVAAVGLASPILAAMRQAWTATRKVLARGTRMETLIHENPAALDTANLEVTPLEHFGTMGPTDLTVDITTWRLEIGGLVKKPLRLSYSELTNLPAIEREVLLICPGFFANHGRWRGVSIKGLLERAELDPAAARVSIEAKARGHKSAGFPLADVLSGKVFLAYQVNGQALPRKHGFPLRLVAEDYYGSDWVKYVDAIRVERT